MGEGTLVAVGKGVAVGTGVFVGTAVGDGVSVGTLVSVAGRLVGTAVGDGIADTITVVSVADPHAANSTINKSNKIVLMNRVSG